MTFQVVVLPAFEDNALFVLHSYDIPGVAVVDPGDAMPILAWLQKNPQHRLERIFLTHHHADHIGGVARLLSHWPDAKVIGFQGDKHRLGHIDELVLHGSVFSWSGLTFQVEHLPGHTNGHVVYKTSLKSGPIAFVGDVIFGGGCGKLFEGTFAQLRQAFQRIKHWKPETLLFCAHEYTQKNLEVFLKKMPSDEFLNDGLKTFHHRLASGLPTLPLVLEEEMKWNLFLRSEDKLVQNAFGAQGSLECIAALRKWRDQF